MRCTHYMKEKIVSKAIMYMTLYNKPMTEAIEEAKKNLEAYLGDSVVITMHDMASIHNKIAMYSTTVKR